MRSLVLAAAVAAVVGYALAELAYGSLVDLPVYGPVTAVVIAAFELSLAKIIRDKVRGRSTRRSMHPMQIARAAALAKASSSAGSLLLGLYAGLLAWTFPRRGQLAAAGADARVAGLAVLACLALVAAALLLERSCRTPPDVRQVGRL